VWWHDEHPLKSIAHPKKYIFQEGKCHTHVEAEPGPDLFEWDETVAYDGEAQYVGRIGREEGDVQLEILPKPYWQDKELLGEKKVEMLAQRRTFDYTINLKQGAEPLWGPRYPISADQLNELDKYIKKILAQGKIVDSTSAKTTHASDAPTLCPVRPVRPEFSSSVRTLPVRPESVPNTRTPLLRPELLSNTPLHPDLTSPLFSISQPPDAFNSPAPSGSRQDYHTPSPSLLA